MNAPVAVCLSLLGATIAKDPRVYVNGERADALRDVVLEDVDIRFDERGNLWIEAPQYRVGSGEGASAHEPAVSGVYWLRVTDHGSSNVTVSVAINGRVATVVKSGQGGGGLDLGPWLHRGANQIELTAPASDAATGGPLIVEIGEGTSSAELREVAISLARDPAAAAHPVERTFVLRVP